MVNFILKQSQWPTQNCGITSHVTLYYGMVVNGQLPSQAISMAQNKFSNNNHVTLPYGIVVIIKCESGKDIGK